MEDTYAVQVIAWVTDDGPDGKAARRLLSEADPSIITSVCWAHQVNLVVGDYLKGSGYMDLINQALEVVKWFNNHSTAHDLLEKEQKITYHDRITVLVLILPVITRWTAHYLSVSRLLQITKAICTCCVRFRDELLVCAGKTNEHIGKAEEILGTVSDEVFWVKLVKYVP